MRSIKTWFAVNLRFLLYIIIFLAGMLAGGYLFRDIEPRSVLALDNCKKCWRPNQLLGLAGAALMTKFPGGLAPWIVAETDYNLAIRHPFSVKHHYVIISKKDIPHLADLRMQDSATISDAFTIIQSLIREHGLDNYRVWSNGSGHQTVNHLHFHLAEHTKLYMAEQAKPQ